jgi:hypothetical protein
MRTEKIGIWRFPTLSRSRIRIRKNANFDSQAIPNTRISCALCMLFDLELCRRLDVRFGTPAD